MNELIDRIKVRLNRGWTRRSMGRDKDGKSVCASSPNAVCWCLDGAICVESSAANVDIENKLVRKLGEMCKLMHGTRSYISFNDNQTNVKPVLALLEACKE